MTFPGDRSAHSRDRGHLTPPALVYANAVTLEEGAGLQGTNYRTRGGGAGAESGIKDLGFSPSARSPQGRGWEPTPLPHALHLALPRCTLHPKGRDGSSLPEPREGHGPSTSSQVGGLGGPVLNGQPRGWGWALPPGSALTLGRGRGEGGGAGWALAPTMSLPGAPSFLPPAPCHRGRRRPRGGACRALTYGPGWPPLSQRDAPTPRKGPSSHRLSTAELERLSW